MKIISVDAEGLDSGCIPMLLAIKSFIKEYHDIQIRIFILEENAEHAFRILKHELKAERQGPRVQHEEPEVQREGPKVQIVKTKLLASSDINPRVILTDIHSSLKNDTFNSEYSMSHAIYDVISGKSDACVTFGHVGHAVFIARAIERHFHVFNIKLSQALMGFIPSMNEQKRIMLDLGGIVNQDLFKLAVLGESFARCCLGVAQPKVGFLNIGTEQNKGKLEIRDAAMRYKNYASQSIFRENGFIEPSDIYMDHDCSVVVSDGFVGNSVLKASEGSARTIFKLIKHYMESSLASRLLSIPMQFILKKVYKRVDPDVYNTAILLGFHSLIVKCHGGSNQKAIYNSLINARSFIPQFALFKNELNDLF